MSVGRLSWKNEKWPPPFSRPSPELRSADSGVSRGRETTRKLLATSGRPADTPTAGYSGMGGATPIHTSLVHLSKFLSFVLRHHPERIGLSLDSGGWVDIEELLHKARQADVSLTREALQQIVEQNDKKRFTFSADGKKIRATQGHSIPVDLQLAPVSPPEFLYHGTSRRFLDSIQRQGLTARGRNHVHLSDNAKTGLAVGQRHGKPIFLTIKAGQMEHDGYLFHRSENGVWLTEAVPTRYIVFPPSTDV